MTTCTWGRRENAVNVKNNEKRELEKIFLSNDPHFLRPYKHMFCEQGTSAVLSATSKSFILEALFTSNSNYFLTCFFVLYFQMIPEACVLKPLKLYAEDFQDDTLVTS